MLVFNILTYTYWSYLPADNKILMFTPKNTSFSINYGDS